MIDDVSTIFLDGVLIKVKWKKNQEILATLQYKPLYNISRSEKWGKKLQAIAYNGACTVIVISK